MGQEQSRISLPTDDFEGDADDGRVDSLLHPEGVKKGDGKGKKAAAAKENTKKILAHLEKVETKLSRPVDSPSHERRIHELLLSSFVDRFTVSESNAITKIVTDCTKGDTAILPAHFKMVLHHIEKVMGYRHVYRTPLHAELFDLFDIEKKGFLDLHRLMSGLGIICKGTAGERLRLSFDLFDGKGKGFLDRSDIFRCLKSSFLEALVLMNLRDDLRASRQRTLIQTARTWTDKIITAVIPLFLSPFLLFFFFS
jgi:Ca2+-binding EF-hand superfamily protein